MKIKTDVSDNVVKTDISNSIKIPVWDPKHFFNKYMKEYGSFTALIFGSRMSGKSNMLKHFLISKDGGKLVDKFDMIIIFSKTILNGHYQKFLKTKLMFDTYKPEVIEAMQKLHEQHKSQGKKFRWLIIFDDCVVNMKYQESITNCFYNSRHFGGSIIFLSQKASEAAQNWKNNITLFVVMKCGSRKERKYIAEDVIADAIEPQLDDKVKESQIFRTSMYIQTKLADNYNAIITTPFCEEKIKQYKAPLHR